jgi:hypothetical protein
VAAGGMSIGHKGMMVAAKTLALTAIDLFTDPDLLAAARAEFEERTGPDFEYAALLGDRAPALDYRREGSGGRCYAAAPAAITINPARLMRFLIPARPFRRLRTAVLFIALAMQAGFASAAPVFPEKLELTEAGVEHSLALTGAAERVFLVFRVYEMAHYHETGRGQHEAVRGQAPGPDEVSGSGAQQLAPEDVIADGPAKAITIRFKRRLDRDRIRAEFDKTIRRNARPEWLDRADPIVRDFVQAIDRDAQAGDELMYYWLEGGRLLAEFNGERFFSVADADFASLIWSIWFGADPVCDVDALLARSGSGVER